MPVYRVRCSNEHCENQEAEVYHKVVVEGSHGLEPCQLCHSRMVKLVALPRRDSWPDEGITLDHVEEHPKHFARKQDLKQYLKKRGLSSGALL